jgi:hypothetical protein
MNQTAEHELDEVCDRFEGSLTGAIQSPWEDKGEQLDVIVGQMLSVTRETETVVVEAEETDQSRPQIR